MTTANNGNAARPSTSRYDFRGRPGKPGDDVGRGGDFALARWKKRLLLTAGASAFALVFIELALRILGISFQDFYKADPVRGVAHRPGARGWFRREGRQYVVINREGFRDREHPATKPPGRYRIAVLGDSFVEALQVRLEDGFGSVLERELARCPGFRGREVEVFNFGVSNYGTAQELLTLRDRVWAVEPDLVLLAFFSGNDVRDNSRVLKQDGELPYFSIQDGTLVLDESFRNSPRQLAERSTARVALKNLIESFRLLQVVRQAWGVARLRTGGNGPGVEDEFAGTEAQRQIYGSATDPAWQSAWDVTERLILLMNEEVKGHGADFAVVTLTTAAQVHPDPVISDHLSDRLGVPDLDEPDRRIKALGGRGGFPVLNLAPPFRDHSRTGRVFLHGFPPNLGAGHWNEQGHALAGRLIAAWLCSRERSGGDPSMDDATIKTANRSSTSIHRSSSASRRMVAQSDSTWARSVASAPIETRTIQRPSRVAGVR